VDGNSREVSELAPQYRPEIARRLVGVGVRVIRPDLEPVQTSPSRELDGLEQRPLQEHRA
jgi:hypothetical protein